MRFSLRGLQLSVLLAATASPAFAQTAPAPSNEPAPASAPVAQRSDAAPDPQSGSPTLLAADDPATLAEARELFWKAHSYFEKGDYVEALRLFEQTYTLRQEPEVLFNLALTHQRLGHCDQSRTLYQKYQDQVRADVTKQLGELSEQCQVPAALPPAAVPPQAEPVPAPFSITVVEPPESREAPPPAPPATPTDTAQSQAFPFKTVGWVAVGVAAIAAGTAVYYAVEAQQAQSDYEDLNGEIRNDPTPPPNSGDQLNTLEDDMNRARKVAVTLGVVSGVLAVGGVTLLVLAPPASAHSEAEPVRDLGLGLRWSGRF